MKYTKRDCCNTINGNPHDPIACIMPAVKPALKDSGKRVEYETGAKRERARVSRFDLLPPRAIRALAEHYGKGAQKYGSRNWESGLPLDDFLDSGLSHIFMYLQGDREEPHLEAAAWNILGYIETLARISEGALPAALLGDVEIPRLQEM